MGPLLLASLLEFFLSVGCGCGMLGLGMWHYAKQKGMTVRQLLNGRGTCQIEPVVDPVLQQLPEQIFYVRRPATPVGQSQELLRVDPVLPQPSEQRRAATPVGQPQEIPHVDSELVQPPDHIFHVSSATPMGQPQELPRLLSSELQAAREMEDSVGHALPGMLM